MVVVNYSNSQVLEMSIDQLPFFVHETTPVPL